jgi:hypothetical protein
VDPQALANIAVQVVADADGPSARGTVPNLQSDRRSVSRGIYHRQAVTAGEVQSSLVLTLYTRPSIWTSQCSPSPVSRL